MTIPAGVLEIEEEGFNNCCSLTTIIVDSDNQNFSSKDGILYNKLKSALIQCPGGKVGGLTIPPGVTTIADFAFSCCARLTNVTIAASVTSIGESAFVDCGSLKSVTIPSSITSIGESAFFRCPSLASARFMGNAPAMGRTVFEIPPGGFKVFYFKGKTGFTSPTWEGYPAVAVQSMARDK